MTTPADASPVPQVPSQADVRALAARLVTPALVVVPVRHHSPACARAVRRAFADHRPSAVLVEGPRSFTPLVDLLTSPEARFPLAVYGYVRDRTAVGRPVQGRGAYYPFCDFSPELIALQEARRHGVPARFIDLDLAEQRATEQHVGSDRPWNLLHEERLTHSASLRRLARDQGCRDPEDLWELLFEADATPPMLADLVARLTAYCLLARHDHTTTELAADGTQAREAEMAWHVRQALAARDEGDGPVLVVVGGFHAVALPGLLDDPPPRPRIGVGRVETGQELIRYSFERLERLQGYAAGMTSPGWHQRVWTEQERGRAPREARRAAALATLLDLAAVLRTRHRHPVPTPSLISAHQHLSLLADLRGRPTPLRTDVVDAVTSCLVQGDADTAGRVVRVALDRVLTGHRTGTVPPGAGTPPLVADALTRLRVQRLDPDEPRNVALDLYRTAQHRATSRLLHGLALLDVPFAKREAGPDFVAATGLGRLQERWACRWTPDTDASLVEASVWGSTVPEAVAAAFAARLGDATAEGRAPGSREATGLLAHALVLGLHDQTGPVLELTTRALTREPAFSEVVGAAGTLGLLLEGREPLEAQHVDGLPDALRAAYGRAVFLGAGLREEEEPAPEVAEGLARLRELLASPAGSELDDEPFWHCVAVLRAEHASPAVRGAASGVAYTAGRLPGPALAGEVQGHLAGTVTPTAAVGYLQGLMHTAREVLWQEGTVVPALDGRLREWSEETFLAHLPDLRLAFATLTPRETDRVATLVAGLHGGPDRGATGAGLGPLVVRDLDEATLERHLALSSRATALLRRDGLGAWVGHEEAP